MLEEYLFKLKSPKAERISTTNRCGNSNEKASEFFALFTSFELVILV